MANLHLKSFPAREGDALWLEWGDPVRRMIVDMGKAETGRKLRERILGLPETDRVFELIVCTHVDGDHIGGLLSCLADGEPIPGLVVKDYWFNGWAHLHGRTLAEERRLIEEIEAYSPADGEEFSDFLADKPWNDAFEGGPVERKADELVSRCLEGGMQLHIIGPTRERLEGLVKEWRENVLKAIASGRLSPDRGAALPEGVEGYGPEQETKPELESLDDLKALADARSSSDNSEANGSSIALIVEYEGKRLLLAGDAFGSDLIEGMQLFSNGDETHFDLVKLPHHGSQANVSSDLVSAIRCRNWLVSTDGTRFKHPDAEAIARIIHYASPERPHILFNARSTFNGWWDDKDWQDRFGYTVEFGSERDGIIFELPPT
nr:hypothetical protein [uncultured Hyphomonas sp.]